MAAQGEKPGKIFYSMGEVAEMFDVNHSLIRHWERHFDILKPQKNKKGNRMFSPEDLRNLKMIYHLVKERGMTLAGAQKYMKASRKKIERDMELSERLQTIRSLLAEVRDALGTDGTVMEDVFREEAVTAPVDVPANHEAVTENVHNTAEEPVAADDVSKEDADALMREAIAALDADEPEPMLDFDPEAEIAEEEDAAGQEKKTDDQPKPLFIEQTLFDL